MGGGGDVARPPDAVNKLAAELVALFALLPVVVLLQVGSANAVAVYEQVPEGE